MARDLLSPVFDALAADTVTPVIRATVEAVNDEEEDLRNRARAPAGPVQINDFVPR